MKWDCVFVSSVLISLIVTKAYASPLKWSFEEGGNNHYYDQVSDNISWTDASLAAKQLSYLGLDGHLVTITSQAENDFITKNWNTGLYWIGAYQADKSSEPAGNWRWVTNESWNYTNWAVNQPDNGGGVEDWAGFQGATGPGGSKFWNDWEVSGGGGVYPKGYFVEYEPRVVPEPLSMLLFSVGGIMIGFARNRRNVKEIIKK